MELARRYTFRNTYEANKTRAFLWSEGNDLEILGTEDHQRLEEKSLAHSVLVIQDINSRWREVLDSKYALPDAFFEKHAEHNRFTDEPDCSPGPGPSYYFVLDGRIKENDPKQAETGHKPSPLVRISCCLIPRILPTKESKTPKLYVFLVNAPAETSYDASERESRGEPRRSVQFKKSQIPVSFELEGQISLWHVLQHLVKSSEMNQMLFNMPTKLFGAEKISEFLSLAAWSQNVAFLSQDIKHISFVEMRSPDYRLRDRMLNHRRDLHDARNSLTEMQRIYNRRLPSENAEEQEYGPKKLWDDYVDALDIPLDEAASLEKILLDSFNLLLSSVSVQQAQRGEKLTILAFLYVPLSFVTGIYGMNLREINNSPLPVWVAVITLLITWAFTFPLLILQTVNTSSRSIQRWRYPRLALSWYWWLFRFRIRIFLQRRLNIQMTDDEV